VDVVKLAPVVARRTAEQRRAAIDEVLRGLDAIPKAEGPDAAHSQDFLYDEFGLPK
jgi:hypothetical protein